MNVKKFLLLILFGISLASTAHSQMQHVQMRVEGMT